MTVVNPKSISGINSITTGSGSDNLLTIHTNNGTERLRIDSTGTTKIVTGIVTTLTATTGIVTTFEATTGNITTLRAPTGIVTTFEATTGNITTLRTPTGISTHFTADKISLPDSSDGSLCIGIGSDLKFNHNGTHSYITEVGGGDLYIQGSDIILRDAGTLEKHIEMTQNGAVDLYHNGTKKFETSSTGATLSGNLGIDANIIHNGDTDTMLSFSAANQADIACGGTVIGRFTTDGLALGNNKQLDILDASGHRSGVINNSDSGANALRISADPDNSASGSHIGFHVDGSEQARIGNGISFNGDTATANFLNDYEEGTFSPTLHNGNSGYRFQYGMYRKVGNAVHFTAFIEVSATPPSSNIAIGGLPFTSANNSQANAYVFPMLTNRTAFGTSGGLNARFYMWPNNSYAQLYYPVNSSSSNFVNVNANGMNAANASNIWMSGTYFTE